MPRGQYARGKTPAAITAPKKTNTSGGGAAAMAGGPGSVTLGRRDTITLNAALNRLQKAETMGAEARTTIGKLTGWPGAAAA